MPLNVRRFYASSFLVLAGFVFISLAQTTEPSTVAVTQPSSSRDVLRDRISRSKAFIAVRNFNAAIVELESIKRESSEPTVNGAVNVLLMNSYLELGDYNRAQVMLAEFYNLQKKNDPIAASGYMVVAGQVIKGARSRAERYRALGLDITDRMLPLEALNDLEKMRETLEVVITHSKEMSKDTAKAADAMALLEEAGNSRGMIARDDYDQRLWRDAVADTREMIVNPRTIVNAVTEVPSTEPRTEILAASVKTDEPTVATKLEPEPKPEVPATLTRDREVMVADKTPAGEMVAKAEKPTYLPVAEGKVADEPKATPKVDEEAAENKAPETEASNAEDSGPLSIGSLIPYATRQAQPTYPPAARIARTSGIVKVEVTVNEKGEVEEVQNASGPPMLVGAAKDAIKKWRFRPFTRDGQPAKANGFVSFNFSL